MKVGFILQLPVLLRAAPRTGEDFPGEEMGRWSLAAPLPVGSCVRREKGHASKPRMGFGSFLAGMLQSC